MTTDSIIAYEDSKIFDKLICGAKKSGSKAPMGWVQIYLNKKKIHEGPNLIVAQGREFVAQKLFGLSTTESGTARSNWYNYLITHFAVGSGGATVSGNDVNLVGPLIGDSYLYQPINLGDESYLEEPSHYVDNTEDPVIHSYENAVKPITTHGEIYLEEVSYEDSPSFYTKVKCTCVIPAGEPSALSPGSSVQISEAGLYFVNSAMSDSDANKTKMFAHICFAPKWVEKEGELIIYWYILC